MNTHNFSTNPDQSDLAEEPAAANTAADRDLLFITSTSESSNRNLIPLIRKRNRDPNAMTFEFSLSIEGTKRWKGEIEVEPDGDCLLDGSVVNSVSNTQDLR
ncbi:hypothetical protein Droror1_Dr00020489 [Drosera rotundifolia]